ncbi:MAG: hypothetical protein KGK30_02835, partial [Elusimicrobia bacterium]|nr:hypothetical protein [Elusimicrobiota bacterium]
MSAGEARAFLWWRDSVRSHWTDKPPALSGEDAAWSGAEEIEEPQLDVRVLNDGEAVYVRLIADGMDGRALLAGAYRQDVTLWFLNPDGKAKAWGVTIPFSALGPSPSPLRLNEAPPVPDVEPQPASAGTDAAPAAALPPGLRVRSALSGKTPVLEAAIALRSLKIKDGKEILLDLVSSPVNPDIRRQLQARPKAGRRRGGRRGETAGPESEVDLPSPLHLRLSIRLAGRP